jgi:tetratricopeptide (TPR) repeat protein
MTTIPLPTIRRASAPRLPALVLAAGLVLAVSHLASAVLPGPTPATSIAPPAARDEPLAPVAPATGADDGLLERYADAIRAWTAGVEANPADYVSATNLGMVYAGRARLTGDLGDYRLALDAADSALAANATYLPARELRAGVLFSLHDFAGALAEGEAVVAAEPGVLQALAVVGDAALELGDLDQARAAYEALGERAPSPPVWSRTAHLAFLEGDRERAISLLDTAITAAAGRVAPEESAFYSFQLGELHRSAGELPEADAAYERALAVLPSHVPSLAGLARIREAQGRRDEAIALLEDAATRMPQPELVAALGDLYALAGQTEAAEAQYALVRRIGEVAAATGSAYDRQLILFAADHALDVEATVAAAQAALRERRDVYGYDALAWALFRANRLDEAATAASRSLALGTPDPRLAYHAGMIAAARGEMAEARRLLGAAVAGAAYLPPLQVPIAEAALADLEVDP